ncbi:MAG: Do family serine endopeptidase [Bacteroidales bacterium]
MKANKILYPLLYSIIGGLIVLLSYNYIVDKPAARVTSAQNDSTPVDLAMLTTSTGEITDFTYAAERTVHAVVHVKTKAMRSQPGYSFGHPFFDQFFFGPRQQEPQPIMGSGSGVIISNDGYIITNNHVIEKAEEIEVVMNDRRTFDAKVIGKDPNTDLAVLKIDENNLPFISFGNSETLKVGEWVLAIGNPFNLNSTITAGIVSAKARNINIMSSEYGIESFIQTDAAVNPGNSGGALVNLKGELVGVNTAIASQTGSFSGYSFAVPSSIAQKVALDIIEFGDVQRAVLGVTIRELNSELAEENNIKELNGVFIEGIAKDGAAEEIGLKKGDVILEVNGVPVNSPNQLQEQISKYRPKEKVELLINRNNKKKQYEATLRNMKGGFEIVRSSEIIEALGAELKEVDSNLMRKLGINHGIQIVDLKDGKLKEGGVEEGFIITRINRNNVKNVEDVPQILQNVSGGVLIEGVYPNGLVAYYAIGM